MEIVNFILCPYCGFPHGNSTTFPVMFWSTFDPENLESVALHVHFWSVNIRLPSKSEENITLNLLRKYITSYKLEGFESRQPVRANKLLDLLS